MSEKLTSFCLLLSLFLSAALFAGCRASFDMSPDKPQTQNQSEVNDNKSKKIAKLESDIKSLKEQNAERIKELENKIIGLGTNDNQGSFFESFLFY